MTFLVFVFDLVGLIGVAFDQEINGSGLLVVQPEDVVLLFAKLVRPRLALLLSALAFSSAVWLSSPLSKPSGD